MATVTVVNDNIGGHLEVYYSFSANVSARTWSLYSELRLVIPSGAIYGAWNATGAHGGNLVGNGIGSLGAGTHTLDSYSTSGHYNSNGDAPSVSISWAFNVRSSWAGYWDNYGSITATGSPIGPDGTPPTGLAATLGTVGPDWAEITVSISSYGSPSTSASRYIEAAILGSSSYGNPYKYKTKKAVNTNTFTIDNSGSGNLTIVPNTQYRYGGYASNTVRSVSTVAGQFTTLPATPVITATDQGHGQIAFTVTHATEGSAKTVTEEYSTDGGTTWTAITGGAFTLTLATQTEVIVRRISDAGESSETVTVTPTFTNGIYASVNRVSTAVEHIYAPAPVVRVLATVDIAPTATYITSIDSDKFIRGMNSLSSEESIIATCLQKIKEGDSLSQIAIRKPSGISLVSMYFYLSNYGKVGSYVGFSSLSDIETLFGVTCPSGASEVIEPQSLVTTYKREGLGTAKVRKVYASVNGKTTLVFEDIS